MTGNQPFIIYISAASDLIAEREALARLIAALPVTLAWRILQTPLYGLEALDLETLQTADFHILVMGMDIRAPVGLELHRARYTGRPTIAFLKKGVPRTPAGQNFIHDAPVSWLSFTDQANLSYQVQQALIKHLLRHRDDYALTPVEIEQLEIIQTTEPPSERPIESQDAGHSAVILSRERFEPSEGVSLAHLTDEQP